MFSIRQNRSAHSLPDFRNLGVIFRVLIGVNALVLTGALIRTTNLSEWWPLYLDSAFIVETLVFFNILFCALLRDLLWRLPSRLGQCIVIFAGTLTTYLFTTWLNEWWLTFQSTRFESGRMVLFALLITTSMLAYFEIRARGLTPAVVEARLHALTARIRPHFLFNSLNAVLSIIRTDPRRAETTLEELADLFRVLMKEQRDLIPLSGEIEFCKQYLNIEKLRLGERLNISWVIDSPLDDIDIPIPPLMLQPLLENAIYHGIEPSTEGGTIDVCIKKHGKELLIEISNPFPQNLEEPGKTKGRTAGNRMALDNIRERLHLYYDLEAQLETEEKDGYFHVRITLPCRT